MQLPRIWLAAVLLAASATPDQPAANGPSSLRGAPRSANTQTPASRPAKENATSEAANSSSEEESALADFEPAEVPLPGDVEYLDIPEEPNATETDDEQRLRPAVASGNCASHPGSRDCYLYRACRAKYCVINGYMIVPGAPLAGMESINGHNAGRWDFLWNAARSHCGSNGCVLITNPVGHRTQAQMHLHFRHYNGGGAHLKHRLERALCGTSGWRHFSECGGAKARLYGGMPGVFSAVAHAYGGGSLAHVGITVWFTSACGGGHRTMVLASTHCSIEHSIAR